MAAAVSTNLASAGMSIADAGGVPELLREVGGPVPPLDLTQMGVETVDEQERHGHGLTAAIGRRSMAAQVFDKGGARRTCLQSAHNARTDMDLLSLDEAVLYDSEACANMIKSARLLVAKHATLAAFQAGDVIAQADQPMDCVYFVLHGEIEAIDASTGETRFLKEGQNLGTFHEEPQPNPNTPRTRLGRKAPPHQVLWGTLATAATAVECAMLTQEQWEMVTKMEKHWDARLVASFLEDLPTFSCLSRAQLHALARQVRGQSYPSDTVIYRQRSDGDDLYLVRTGYVRILKDVEMDQGSRTRLNQITSHVSHLTDEIDMLASPRGKPIMPRTKSAFDAEMSATLQLEECNSPCLSPKRMTEDAGGDAGVKPGSPKPIDRRQSHTEAGPESPVLRIMTPTGEEHPRERSPTKDSHLNATSLATSRAWSPRAPHPISGANHLFVEVANLGSGKLFGDRMSTVSKRACSAVTETHTEVFQISKNDVQHRLGDLLTGLWEGEKNGIISSDEGIKAKLKSNMEWELYKKKAVQEVLQIKALRSPRR